MTKTTKKKIAKKAIKKVAKKSVAKKPGKKLAKQIASAAEPLLGKSFASLSVLATGLGKIKLSHFSGKKIILYFYPKDNTPGCTVEGQDFRDNLKAFERKNTVVLGVSPDSLSSHEGFIAKQKFNFELISDEDKKICEKFRVWVEKSMYGRKYMGVERSTFILDEKGKLIRSWRKVKVKGHVQEVLAEV